MHNVRDFGAAGNGVAKDTAAIQAAIDAGGTVFIPAGTYLTGTLYLKSNGGLEMEPGAVLLASPDPADYNAPDFCPQNSANPQEGASGAHLIVAVEQKNVFIHGGKIDGNARTMYQGCPMTEAYSGIRVYDRCKWRTSQLLFFCESSDIRISDVILEDSAYWSCFLYGCENAFLSRLRIWTDSLGRNNDGIDIDCCRFVTVSDCHIDVGDDGITLRGNPHLLKNKKPCEWITVTNCVIRSGYAHGIRIGVGSGIVRHCTLSNLAIYDTRCAFWLCSKYSEGGTGAEISDIGIRNCTVDVLTLALIRHDYKFVEKVPFRGTMSDISFSGISGKVRMTAAVCGNGIGTMKNIFFSDLHLTVPGHNDVPENHRIFVQLGKEDNTLFRTKNCENVQFSNVTADWEDPAAWKGIGF